MCLLFVHIIHDVCPHATMCVLILLYVFSYYYVCVGITPIFQHDKYFIAPQVCVHVKQVIDGRHVTYIKK
jgi:hypothetical protein